jgi:uronate dehydrogenase
VVATDVAGSGCLELDVTDAAACRAAFDGVDAVVHLAEVPDPKPHWDQLLPANVIDVHSMATAAMATRTRRLMLASCLQAVSAYPADLQVRPMNRRGRPTCTAPPRRGPKQSAPG